MDEQVDEQVDKQVDEQVVDEQVDQQVQGRKAPSTECCLPPWLSRKAFIHPVGRAVTERLQNT